MVHKTRIAREELARSAVWLLFAVFGWALVLTETALPETGLLWGGLVASSVAGMTALVTALRVATGESFRSQRDLVFFLAALFGGMCAVYLLAVGSTSPAAYGLAVVLVLAPVVRAAFTGHAR